MKNQKAINYSSLKTGDIVCCGGVGLFAYAIRLVTAGLWKRHSIKDVAVHVGILVRLSGQIFIAEMLGSGLAIRSLEEYRKNKRSFIISIGRSSELTDENRSVIEQKIAHDFRKGIEYDWSGDLAFLLKKVEDDPKKNFCSEYAAIIMRDYGLVEVIGDESIVSPVMLQVPSKAIPSLENIDFEE